MRKWIKIILIMFSFLVLLFSLGGFVMVGSFFVSAPLEQKEHYQLVINIYTVGIIISFFSIIYLTFFVKIKKNL